MRARRREINIFNMSLLDILCGALGAFCFMMLVALPYYKPAGTAPDLRKAQAETEKLMRDLDQMKTKMRDQKSVEEMEELLRRLEAQVKALQGQVNILSAEKQKLAETNQQLISDNNKLAEANKIAMARLARRKTFVVSAHCTTFIDLLLTDEPAGGKTREAINEEVSAFLDDGNSVSAAHLYLTKSGSATEIRDQVDPKITHRIYVRLRRVPAAGEALPIDGSLITVGREQHVTRWPPFKLSAERPWALVGTVTIDQNNEPIFKAATEEERDEEWRAVTRSAPPSPPAATIAASPNEKEVSEKFRKLMRMPPDNSGAHDAEVLQLTDELLRELPPNDLLRRDVELHRKIILENKARREGAAPAPKP